MGKSRWFFHNPRLLEPRKVSYSEVPIDVGLGVCGALNKENVIMVTVKILAVPAGAQAVYLPIVGNVRKWNDVKMDEQLHFPKDNDSLLHISIQYELDIENRSHGTLILLAFKDERQGFENAKKWAKEQTLTPASLQDVIRFVLANQYLKAASLFFNNNTIRIVETVGLQIEETTDEIEEGMHACCVFCDGMVCEIELQPIELLVSSDTIKVWFAFKY